ncbi:EexN family lipoprotein [Bartonella krasnovii]|uniref:EexN family lipoprotein n=1 Tax=Bartonella krasnovii TaxID=2267275 RepID=UPI001F4D13E4|nr:EexN family lipoprotein [Bartonella krasnovii]UNF54911.1 EexN family lipoprotein [Bartonella krasnovii]
MNKVIITALLFCIGFVVAGCEKTYSVEDFKKDEKLMQEWGLKCENMEESSRDKSKNCRNVKQAYMEFLFGFH